MLRNVAVVVIILMYRFRSCCCFSFLSSFSRLDSASGVHHRTSCMSVCVYICALCNFQFNVVHLLHFVLHFKNRIRLHLPVNLMKFTHILILNEGNAASANGSMGKKSIWMRFLSFYANSRWNYSIFFLYQTTINDLILPSCTFFLLCLLLHQPSFFLPLVSFGALWIFPFSFLGKRANAVRVNQISCKSVPSQFTRKSWSCTYTCKLCFIRNLDNKKIENKSHSIGDHFIWPVRCVVVVVVVLFNFCCFFSFNFLLSFRSTHSQIEQKWAYYNVIPNCHCCCTSLDDLFFFSSLKYIIYVVQVT